MKPQLTYYGGKQKLASRIVDMIPKHRIYCEPFFGGGAVFFAKERSSIEVINDTNGELVNFYKMVKTNFKKLEKEIRSTLHSHLLHSNARAIYHNPHLFDEVKRAWAVWVLANQSFISRLDGPWSFSVKQKSNSSKNTNKKNAFTTEYASRLENVQVECDDALKVIATRDTKETFFYLDPPYYNANCANYRGYSKQNFENLLQVLSKIQGKFLLSSYPSELIDKYILQNKWHTQKMDMALCVSISGRRKTEVLTANYMI